jgi:hypothetical protein
VTTSPARRTRSTWIALGATTVILVVAICLTVLGAATLANSRAGRDAGDDSIPVLSLPATPTALVGVVDGDGVLTSVALLALDPSGSGGSMLSIAATADSTLDLGDERLPLNETLATQGADGFRLQAEALTSVSFDLAELADAERLTELFTPLGTIAVDLPQDVTIGAGEDESIVPAGLTDLDATTAAAILTATSDDGPDHLLEPARDAVWAGVATRASEVGATETAGDPGDVRPADLDAFVARLFCGDVGWRNLRYAVPPPERNPRGVDVVVPGRAEVLLVVGQIAPARVAAPNPSLTFRVESTLPGDVLEPLDVNNADVATIAISRLLYVQANVVSVETAGDEAPDVTQVYVADAGVMDVVEQSYPLVFGELEVLPAEYRIAGVDVIVVLGRSFLEKMTGEPLTEADLGGTAFASETTVAQASGGGD